MNADRLLSSALPLTRSDGALSSSQSTTDETRMPWNQCGQTPHLNCFVSNSPQQCPLADTFTLVIAHVTSVTAPGASHPCYEHHTPVMSITPLLQACGTWLLQIMQVHCLSSYGFLRNKHKLQVQYIQQTVQITYEFDYGPQPTTS